MKPIVITTVKQKDQRYDTVGDYGEVKLAHWIKVCYYKGYVESEIDLLGVMLHEFIEKFLCKQRGIPEKIITQWDLKHLDSKIEPGEIKGAPYFNEHAFANKIEDLFVKELKKHGKKKSR